MTGQLLRRGSAAVATLAVAVLIGSSAAAAPALAAESLAAGSLAAGSGAQAIPDNSGLPWASGAYITKNTVQAQAAFGAFRGAPTDVVVTWPARKSWADLTDPAWLIKNYENAPQTTVLGIPPFPEGQGGSLAACASGAYNGQWQQIARTLLNAGMADSTVIRMGWEFNGDWYEWAARKPSDFASCWRQVFTAAESVAPALRWDWNPNRGKSQIGIDATKAWPGDEYVDIVGLDSYDGYPGATNEKTWKEHYEGAYGLRFWRDFAKAHGKKMSIPEWGVYPGTAWAGHNGGDNPFYIAKMFAFFRANASMIAYESYFNEPASYYAGALELNPRAAAEYKKQIAASLGLGGRASGTDDGTSTAGGAGTAPTPGTTPTADPTATPSVTATATQTPRDPVRQVALPEETPAVIAPFDDGGVSVSAPVVRAGSDGVKIGSTLGVRTPQSLTGVRLVVTDPQGGAVTVGDLTWCLSVRDRHELNDFTELPSGRYDVRAEYTVDGRSWVRGPGTTFDVW